MVAGAVEMAKSMVAEAMEVVEVVASTSMAAAATGLVVAEEVGEAQVEVVVEVVVTASTTAAVVVEGVV